LGKYIAKVYAGDRTWLDPVFNPIEKLFYKVSGIDPKNEMTWKQHLVALLTINLLWFLMSMLILMNMSWLPLNPDNNPSQSADLAFNTTISFLVNCNLQHYSGETGISYLRANLVDVFTICNCRSGNGCCRCYFQSIQRKSTKQLGNFYDYFLKSCIRILLPLSIVIAAILVFEGTPMTFEGKILSRICKVIQCK
jgi:K+-transporting ATPase ATPase A chain